ncbi:MAG: bacillithiol biosynthesis cysteine-adding enzyme BshC [Ignavibacteria bacterium]|nr:bacillithiol biosynthesis cysteine-adding enzyme BshC [Ignavibacteria bacterium]
MNQWLDYREIQSASTAFSKLFVDYVTNYERVHEYYESDFRDPRAWERSITTASQRTLDRSTLVNILSLQNRAFHCGVRTLANIDALLNDNTVAVVTGQQVGIFTGPLYTIYKALTTIKLTEQLSARYPDYSFVPVFWLEGEDHDFEEVRSINVIDKDNNLLKASYNPETAKDDANYGAVGRIEFDETIDSLINQLHASLLETEFTPQVMSLLRTAYQKGMTFNRSFVHLMNDLLEDSGLIFLDPNDPAIKQLLKPLFRREIEHAPKTCTLMIGASVELEKHYLAQIKPKPINLFLFHKGGRHLIEPHPLGYSLKGTRQRHSKEALTEMLENNPELFSPNVALRPICQDALLPTACYVAGPAEISYFAQLQTVYAEFGIQMPILFPRASVTIIEERVQRVLEKYSLEVKDFFGDREMLGETVAGRLSDVRLEELFGGTIAGLNESLEILQQGLSQIDPTLAGGVATAKNKISYQIENLKHKAIAAQKRAGEATLRQIDKAHLHLFPFSNLQERELSIVHFLNKYGLDFLRWLKDELIVDKHRHQVVKMHL